MKQALAPRVSVIINVHNGEKYLSEAIGSVLSQRFCDFELIIWDNASNDRTAQIAAAAIQVDSRVVVVRCDNKKTLYAARNEALKSSRGEYVAFLDSDDLWRNDKLEIAIEKLCDQGCDVFYSNFEIMKGRANHRTIAYRCPLPEGFILEKLCLNYTIGISTVVFRREALMSLEGPFSELFSIIGDFDLILRLSAQRSFASYDSPLMTYRVHDLNLSSTASDLRLFEIGVWEKLRLIHSAQNIEFLRKAHVSLLLDALLAGDLSRGKSRAIIRKILSIAKWPEVLVSKVIWKSKNVTSAAFDLLMPFFTRTEKA